MPSSNTISPHTGYRIDKEDKQYLLDTSMSMTEVNKAMKGFQRPDVVDPTSWSKIRNQGQEGSCQGHSIAAAGEGCYHVASHSDISFSPDAAYYLTQKFDGLLGADNGSTIAGGMKMAYTIGFCPEPKMPYSDRYNPQDLPKDINEICAPYKIKKHIVFQGPDYFAQAIDWIGNGFGFLSYGIDWGVTLNSQGIASWSPQNRGGHANAGMGYQGPLSADGYPELLRGKNSWGDWGPLHGWYFWTRAMFNKVMAHPNSVLIGISDMSDIRPRKISWAENPPC